MCSVSFLGTNEVRARIATAFGGRVHLVQDLLQVLSSVLRAGRKNLSLSRKPQISKNAVIKLQRKMKA